MERRLENLGAGRGGKHLLCWPVTNKEILPYHDGLSSILFLKTQHGKEVTASEGSHSA